MESRDVVVIGAGVIGLMSAIRLRKSGADVVIVDDPLQTPASVRNAGLIVPSYSEPVPSRGDVAHFMKNAFSGGATVGMSLPKTSGEIQWMLRAAGAAFNASSHNRRAELLIRLSDESLRFLERMVTEHSLDAGWQRSGSLQVFQSAANLQAAGVHAERMRKLGVEANVLDRDAVRAIEPALPPTIAGALQFPGDAMVDPVRLTAALRGLAAGDGVRFVDASVADFVRIGDRVVGVFTGANEIRAERIVVAAGAWSAPLLAKLGVNLPVAAGKGYALDIPGGNSVRFPLILHESHVVVTPLADRLRLTTGLQLVGFDATTSARVMHHLRGAVQRTLSGVTIPREATLMFGFRPLAPDGVPIVGALKKHPELVVAAGHGVLGITLAAHSGELVKRILAGGDNGRDAIHLSPHRFGI